MPFTLPATGRVRLVDMDGVERALDGATLTLSPSPVYLIVEEDPR